MCIRSFNVSFVKRYFYLCNTSFIGVNEAHTYLEIRYIMKIITLTHNLTLTFAISCNY